MANVCNQNTTQSSTNELLSFVSNASRELKDMLGKVDTDERREATSGTCLSLPLPATPMSSPVPSPTPSCVSSVSDQEVPSMSPRFFASGSQKRSLRKRSHDSLRDVPFSNFSAKFRRTDSVGDYDEYQSCALKTPHRPSVMQSSPHEIDYVVQQLVCQKSLQARQTFDQLYGAQLDSNQHQSYNRISQQSTTDGYTVRFGNQPSYTGHGMYCQSMHSYHIPPTEPVPDFADLVSWMLAEDFLDAESLSTLLSRC